MKYIEFSCGDEVVLTLMAYLMGDREVAQKSSYIPSSEVEAESMAAVICGSKSGNKRWRKWIAEKPGSELAYWVADCGSGRLYIRTDMFGILKTGEKCVRCHKEMTKEDIGNTLHASPHIPICTTCYEKEKSHAPTKLGQPNDTK